MAKDRVLVTQKGCGACPEAKTELKKAGIRFKAVDIDSTEGQKLQRKFKFEYVPAMVINGRQVHDIEKWFKK